MKTLFKFILFAGIVFLGYYIYKEVRLRSKKTQAQRKIEAMPVEAVPAVKATLVEQGRFTGSLSPHSRFVVAPKISGRLEKLTVDIGDKIESGQLLAELDDEEQMHELNQAKAELDLAKAATAEFKSAFDVSKRKLDRYKTLFEKKVTSESEMEDAESNYITCKAKYEIALCEIKRREAVVKAAEARLAYTDIKSAWEGSGIRVIGEKFVDEGEMLSANQPIVSMLDNSIMSAKIGVIEKDYTRIRIGQPVTVDTDAYPGRIFKGEIVRIAPLFNELSRQAEAEIEISNKDELLKPGMFIRVGIEFEKHENVQAVPVAAVIRRDNKTGVFVPDADGGKAKFVLVRTGITDKELVEIIEPVLTGPVITLGNHLVEDGTAVALPDDKDPAPQKKTDKKQ